MGLFYKNVVLKFVDNLIRENAIKSQYGYTLNFTDLDEMKKEDFAALLIKEDAITHNEWDFIAESDKSHQISNQFTNYLLTASKDEMYEFINNLKIEALKYYASIMQELIDERIGLVESEDMSELGKSVIYSKNNGERMYV